LSSSDGKPDTSNDKYAQNKIGETSLEFQVQRLKSSSSGAWDAKEPIWEYIYDWAPT
jgi:hypothetical protein